MIRPSTERALYLQTMSVRERVPGGIPSEAFEEGEPPPAAMPPA